MTEKKELSLRPADLGTAPTKSGKRSFDRYLTYGLIGVLALVGGGGGWALTTEIAGAVIAAGSIVVESNPKTLQHLDGGIVEEIMVQNGDLVNSNDIVLRLNPTDSKADRNVANNRLYASMAQVARLQAERDVRSTIKWPEAIKARADDPAIKSIMRGQEKLFNARRTARFGQTDQLRNRITQTEAEIRGVRDLRAQTMSELSSVEQELSNLQSLAASGYVSGSRVMAAERQQAGLRGRIATYDADIARLTSSISEIEIQISQVRRDSNAEILTELRENESTIADLQTQLTSLDDRVQRIEIKAPVTGIVHDMTVTTTGGVVMPGEPIMQIIPKDDRLIIEAMVAPQDIDQVYKTQTASVILSAFDQNKTPRLTGTVAEVSANTLLDEASGLPYYSTRVEISAEELARLDGLVLVPGMPAEVFINTGNRTVISYLTKPITDTMRRSFREN